MALYPGVKEALIAQFKGAILRPDPYAVDPAHALYAQNVQYTQGTASQSEVGTRMGHSAVVQTYSGDGPVTAMANWAFTYLNTLTSAVLYYAPAVGIRGYQLSGVGAPAFTAVLVAQTGAAGMTAVITAQRAIFAFYGSTGRLSSGNHGIIYGWGLGGDSLFAAPLTIAPVPTEPSTGVITAGLHYIAYLPTTRNGFTTKLSPCPGDVFTPVAFTASGSKNCNVTITGAMPSYMVGGSPAASIQICMTTVANPNRWYAVPGATASAISPVSITFSISDDTLAATGTDVTDQMNILTETVSGTAPFVPTSAFAFGSRMGYCTSQDGPSSGTPTVYFSEQNDYQHLTADQHNVPLPSQSLPVCGFALRDVAYVASPFSLFSYEDNGGVPVTWTPPQKVDGSVGVLSPTCVLSRPDEGPSLGYALIASERGFFLFQGGSFPALPLSYYQIQDWSRINWLLPTTVKVTEDQHNKKFIVLAPLNDTVASVSGTGPYTVTTTTTYHLYQTGLNVTIDGVTGTKQITVTGNNTFTITGGSGAPTVGGIIRPQSASHRMTWDYTDGDTPEQVKYSLDNFAQYIPGGVCTVQNPSNNLVEVWYGPATTDSQIIRQCDGTEAHPYSDVTQDGAQSAINSLYKTSLLPWVEEDSETTVHDYHGVHLRLTGSGYLGTLQVAGVDGTLTANSARLPYLMSLTPGQEILFKWFLRSARATVMIGTNATDTHFSLALLRMYYTNSLMQT